MANINDDSKIAARLHKVELDDNKRQKAVSEWEGLELAQKIEREDNDADLAAKLGAEDAIRYRLDCIERAALAAADELLAKSMQDEQIQVTLQRRESLKVVADADAVIARELQIDEDVLSDEADQKHKIELKRKHDVDNWINPVVRCQQDEKDVHSLRMFVCLPELGHTDVNVQPKSPTTTLVSITASSVDKLKKFSFDLNLKGDTGLRIQPQHVKADYDHLTAQLNIRIVGIRMNEQQDVSMIDQIKQVFSFLVGNDEPEAKN